MDDCEDYVPGEPLSNSAGHFTNMEPQLPAKKSKINLSLDAELARRRLCAMNLLDFAVAFADFGFTVDPFHSELCKLLDNFLIAVKKGKRPLLVVYAPPRSGKSQIVVRALVPFAMGREPSYEMVVVTHTGDLAASHGADIRAVISNPYYNKIFPGVSVDKKKMAADNFRLLGNKGKFKGVGSEGNLTGNGANILICDDLIKDITDARSETHTQKVWDWLQSVAKTRLDPHESGMIVMATRWSEIDPTGRLLDSPMGKKAVLFGYPALNENMESNFPLRQPTEFLLDVKASISPKIWSSLYQGKPVSEEGLIFRSEHIQIVDRVPPREELNIYITADPAASSVETSDYWTYCVFGVDHEDQLYLLDMYHKRGIDSLTYLRSLFLDCDKYKPNKVYMEACHASNVLAPIINKMMREAKKYYTIEYPTTGNKDKVSRAASIAARMGMGKVSLKRLPAIDFIEHELLSFPDGKHDDIVDCMSMMGRVMDTTVTASLIPIEVPKVNEGFTWNEARKHRQQKSKPTSSARSPRRLFG